ncbi:isochorismatase family protein [Ottowia sp.]|uniref:isochorismatase family protein n=1 Tax=Ottowia sp. TaxID=1898956 RepID=UPI002CBF81DE|nr:isochorismatase family protein [Ottowia sp.]
MLLQADDCQLVLVDFQARLMPAIHEGVAVLANARRLAQLARWLQVPVWATEQVPDKLGATDEALAALCERVVAKAAFSGAAALQPLLAPPAPAQRGNARSLPKHLQKPAPAEPERGTLLLAGCEAHVCLLQTALDLLDRDWDVWVVADACGSRTERNRDAAYDRLAAAGCELVSTEMVGFEWLGDAGHPRFKDWQALIR